MVASIRSKKVKSMPSVPQLRFFSRKTRIVAMLYITKPLKMKIVGVAVRKLRWQSQPTIC